MIIIICIKKSYVYFLSSLNSYIICFTDTIEKIRRSFRSFVCLCWGLTSQSTIFQSCRDGATASWVINQYFRGVKCLAQGHNTAAVGFEPPTSRSRVRHSTTEPPRSPVSVVTKHNVYFAKDNCEFGSLFTRNHSVIDCMLRFMLVVPEMTGTCNVFKCFLEYLISNLFDKMTKYHYHIVTGADIG